MSNVRWWLDHPKQGVAALAFTATAIITANCRCARVNKCHWYGFLLSWGVGTAIVFHDNLIRV